MRLEEDVKVRLQRCADTSQKKHIRFRKEVDPN